MKQKPPTELPPTSYRQNRRNQERNLLFLVIFVLVVIGTGLIGLIWGIRSAFLGGICLVSGAVLIVGIWLLLRLLENLVRD